jgi:RNA polymerase-binding transcription factor
MAKSGEKATPARKSPGKQAAAKGAAAGGSEGKAAAKATPAGSGAKPAGKETAAKPTQAKSAAKVAAKTAGKTAAKRAATGTKPATKAAGKTAKAPTKAPAKAPAKTPAKTAAKSATRKTAAGKKATGTAGPAKRATATRAPQAGGAAAAQAGQTSPAALAVRADESPWTAEELEAVKAELTDEAERLRDEIRVAESDLQVLLRDYGEGAGEDQADAGSKTFEREHEMSLANNSRDMLLQAERALSRIADGSYGICESCGNPIGKARLQAFPRATLCVTCKQREERR